LYRFKGDIDVSKAEWGTKRICPSCTTRYYDMKKNPPVCPKCGTVFDPEITLRARRGRAGGDPLPGHRRAWRERPGEQPLPDGQRERQDRVPAHGERDEDGFRNLLDVIPLSLGFLQEMKVCRAYYYRGAAMEVVDGEMEVLLAGEKEHFGLGEHDYRPQGRVITNLPPGKFTLIVRTNALRLDWQPLLHQTGGKVSREVQIR